jgi:hypothetical protein
MLDFYLRIEYNPLFLPKAQNEYPETRYRELRRNLFEGDTKRINSKPPKSLVYYIFCLQDELANDFFDLISTHDFFEQVIIKFWKSEQGMCDFHDVLSIAERKKDILIKCSEYDFFPCVNNF